jgi:nucleotide-binding universal stress UspA family protein
MYDRILFPTDGSDPAAETLPYALRIASEHGATVHVLNVADTGRDSVTAVHGEVVDALEEEGRQIVDDAARAASDAGVSVVTEVLQGDPHRTIVDYAEREDVGCIVMATHGRRGLHRFLLGSVTERVINTATVPVVAVDPSQSRRLTYPPRRVLVPTDGSRGAAVALERGIEVAAATGADLHLLHVVETGSLGPETGDARGTDELTERADELLAEATQQAEAASLDSVTGAVEHGDPATAIRSYVEDHEIDLTLLGTHGQTDFSRYVMGGVSSKLVRTSRVPVMWVRDPDPERR